MQRIELETDPLLLDLLSSRRLITVPSLWGWDAASDTKKLPQEFDDARYAVPKFIKYPHVSSILLTSSKPQALEKLCRSSDQDSDGRFLKNWDNTPKLVILRVSKDI